MSLELLERFLSYVINKEQLFEILKNISETDDLSSMIDSLVGCSINNLSEFLVLFRKIAKAYLQTAYLTNNGDRLDTTKKLCDCFEISFLGVRNEEIHAIGLDDDLHIICEGVLNIGSPSKVDFSLRQFAEFVVKNNLSRIAIAHNHPNGTCFPSDEDVICTKKIIDFLDMIDVELIDHIIVGRGGAFSMRSSLRGCEIWDRQ